MVSPVVEAAPATVHAVVVYALPQRQWSAAVALAPGSTVAMAIEAAGLIEAFPELLGRALEAGIFNRVCSPGHVVRDGDRIEIYRPLQIDPKQARRLRARRRDARNA